LKKRRCFMRAVLLMLLLAVSACSTVVRVPADPRADVRHVALPEAQQGYARVLQRHVNDRGEVDFAALRDDTGPQGIGALERYVQAMALTPLDAVPAGNTRLAHLINAYNALSIYNVIASGIPRSHAGWAKVRFFVLRKFEIGGAVMSLYAFENDVIRKLNEPRVHFALNCMAVSCPVLPRAPFTAEKLTEELEDQAHRFFARAENLRIDHERRTVHVNEILSFFKEDFVPAHAPNLIAYIQRYRQEVIPADYVVAFIPYDWTIANSRPNRDQP